MMRASTARPALAWSRQWAAAWRATAKWPLRCTRTTASHSSSAALANMRSRTKPALFTTASRPPNAVDGGGDDPAGAVEVGHVVAVGDRLAAGGADLVHHLAGRPACRRRCRRARSPRSFTTTRAPWRASSSAWARPSPRPAPVTITTRPSQMPLMAASMTGEPNQASARRDEDDLAADLAVLQVGERAHDVVERVLGRLDRVERARRRPAPSARPRSAWLPSGSRPVHAPQSTPTSVRLLSSTWLIGRRGISPPAKPITR